MTENTDTLDAFPVHHHVIEPDKLAPFLAQPSNTSPDTSSDKPTLLILDLGDAKTYHSQHLPGAILLSYEHLIHGQLPAPGLLPKPDRLQALMYALGITPETWVVAYDDEGGGKAARLIWVLDCLGHQRTAYLNGGIHAWVNEGHPTSTQAEKPQPLDTLPVVTLNRSPIAEVADVLAAIDSDRHALLDVRSPAEYAGLRGGGFRKGHIPGAVNMNWTDAMDRARNLRLMPDDVMRPKLAELGVTPDKEIITYCYSHHRAAHSYFLLKHLGFPKVSGYAGAWAEWGSRPDLPIE